MESVHNKVSADPNNPYYLAIKSHLAEAFGSSGIAIEDVTWLDVCLCMENVLKSTTATVVMFPSINALDAVRNEILTDFSFTKVVLKENSIVCVDPADATFIKTKYL